MYILGSLCFTIVFDEQLRVKKKTQLLQATLILVWQYTKQKQSNSNNFAYYIIIIRKSKLRIGWFQ